IFGEGENNIYLRNVFWWLESYSNGPRIEFENLGIRVNKEPISK
ncbi:unnamed protein product, partial [marine sediment metagenome]